MLILISTVAWVNYPHHWSHSWRTILVNKDKHLNKIHQRLDNRKHYVYGAVCIPIMFTIYIVELGGTHTDRLSANITYTLHDTPTWPGTRLLLYPCTYAEFSYASATSSLTWVEVLCFVTAIFSIVYIPEIKRGYYDVAAIFAWSTMGRSTEASTESQNIDSSKSFHWNLTIPIGFTSYTDGFLKYYYF